MASPRHVIPAGQEELLRRVLDPPEGLPDDWEFVRAAIDGPSVEARYRRGDREGAVVRLVHPDAASQGAVRTTRFAFSPTGVPAALAHAIEVSLLAREHRIVWQDAAEQRTTVGETLVDPEWCALEAGVKRVLRVSVAPEGADDVERRYRELGAECVRLEFVAEVDDQPRAILYVARSATDAERARALEASLIVPGLGSRERSERMEELGWELGYPSCCVEAFVRRLHPGLGGALLAMVSGRVGSEPYLAARDAWVPRPEPRLNPFLRAERRFLIGFEPCRYDCAEALAWANRVADVCAERDPEWLARTDSELAQPIVVSPDGAVARVTLERRIEPMRIVRAQGDDDQLTSRLVGAEAHDNGLLTGRGVAWCLLVDFGWRSSRRSPATALGRAHQQGTHTREQGREHQEDGEDDERGLHRGGGEPAVSEDGRGERGNEENDGNVEHF